MLYFQGNTAYADVSESADEPVLETGATRVWVQVPSSAPEASRAKLGGLFSFAIKYDTGSAFLRLSLLLRCRFLRQFFISFMPARGSRKPQKVDLIFAYVIQSHTKSVIGRPGRTASRRREYLYVPF